MNSVGYIATQPTRGLRQTVALHSICCYPGYAVLTGQCVGGCSVTAPNQLLRGLCSSIVHCFHIAYLVAGLRPIGFRC